MDVYSERDGETELLTEAVALAERDGVCVVMELTLFVGEFDLDGDCVVVIDGDCVEEMDAVLDTLATTEREPLEEPVTMIDAVDLIVADMRAETDGVTDRDDDGVCVATTENVEEVEGEVELLLDESEEADTFAEAESETEAVAVIVGLPVEE